jgi:hypothetical protein
VTAAGPAEAAFQSWPELLTLKGGRKVTSARIWWEERRPEIVEDFERGIFGRVPKEVPKVTWSVNMKHFIDWANKLIKHAPPGVEPR